MSSEPLPPLRCESRRPRPPHGGTFKWMLALVVVSASMLDALWLIPAQRDAERQRRDARRAELSAKRDLKRWSCASTRPAQPPPPRATRVNDILLLAPSRVSK